jgi:TPP-dependent 2-oxoacid decarboxylase
MKQTIGDFLLRRLQKVDVRHIFDVPGDFNHEFMQLLEVIRCRLSGEAIGSCQVRSAP